MNDKVGELERRLRERLSNTQATKIDRALDGLFEQFPDRDAPGTGPTRFLVFANGTVQLDDGAPTSTEAVRVAVNSHTLREMLARALLRETERAVTGKAIDKLVSQLVTAEVARG